MRIFGSVDVLVEGRHRDIRIGRVVANTGFLRALLTHGDFDRYHLFCPSASMQKSLREVLEDLVGRDLAARVDLLHQLELPARLARSTYAAFHCGGWSRYHPRLAWLRAASGAAPFAITGLIHSIDMVDASLAPFLAAPHGPCDAVVCSSIAGREAFRRMLEGAARRQAGAGAALRPFPGRLPVIPLGLPEEAFASRDRRACRAAAGLPDDALVLLWVGRLAAQDKADLVPLLRVVRRLARGRVLRLVLAGGADRANLQSITGAVTELGLSEQVVLAPDLEDARKWSLLGAADVFVSPVDNLQETFGIAVAEAMAAGLPVVASDWDGYRDLVEHETTGLLVPTCWARPPLSLARMRNILEPRVAQLTQAQGTAVDLGALEAALLRLAGDRGLRERMGEAGRRRAEARFGWATVMRQHCALWRELEEAARGYRPPAGEDPGAVDAFEAFSHYASHLLAASDVLALTADGIDVVEGRAAPPAVYEDVAPVLDGRAATALLLDLRAGPRPLGELGARIPGRERLGPGDLEYAALWLLKNGLVARVAGGATVSPHAAPPSPP